MRIKYVVGGLKKTEGHANDPTLISWDYYLSATHCDSTNITCTGTLKGVGEAPALSYWSKFLFEWG